MYKAIDKWFLPSLKSRGGLPSGKKHLLFCIADHFEPGRTEKPETGDLRPEEKHQHGAEKASKRVKRWTEAYESALADFRDADDKAPQHTFFYPAEEYDEKCLEQLAKFCRNGFGEVEIQLHHRNDTPEGFKKKIATFKEQLRRLGFLGCDEEGKRRFGFVHGNWSLCNSRADGDWCGVNEELGLLQKLGCYADFTFPSAPSETQPRMVNCIYRAVDAPGRPRGHDTGEAVRAGSEGQGAREICLTPGAPASSAQERKGQNEERSGADLAETSSSGRVARGDQDTGLMLITGPLGMRWQGVRPRLENGALTSVNPPTPARMDYWADRGIGIAGKPDWVFVKVHMHGLNEPEELLTTILPEMHKYLQEKFNDGSEWCLHYTSAREMYNIARAAEAGKSGNPSEWRDFEIRCPEYGE